MARTITAKNVSVVNGELVIEEVGAINAAGDEGVCTRTSYTSLDQVDKAMRDTAFKGALPAGVRNSLTAAIAAEKADE